MPLNQRRRQLLFFSLLLLAFLFRLFVGLCSQFRDSDTKQIYLLGLKFYTTHAWPYFGPDVVWGEIQIPGALQALLVGGPFFILPIPEAPYVLLNILSFAALCLLAWYCCKRLPELPRWFVWSWLLTAPWVLDLSTSVYNPSYVLPGSILFFVGALEIYPFTTKHVIAPWLAGFMMGFALFWVMQLHLSWLLLVPYVWLAFYYHARRGGASFLRALGWFALGSSVTGSLLLPTYLHYGLARGAGGTASTVTLNTENLTSLWGILIRLLSFASFEVPRLLGPHTTDRLAFLKQEPWLIPFVVILFVAGTAQVVALIVSWFFSDHQHEDWKAVKYLFLFNVLIAYVSFLFSIKPPQSNHLYVTLPIPMIYSLYCWSRFLSGKRGQVFKKVFAILIACGIVFHLGLALHNRSLISLYTERQLIESAIRNKDYRTLGDRRPNTLY
ncbi:MAG TPA: hypothetical protein VGO73_09175 [Pyrinomonadaceae bacterium]|jgi:hypothetical protein|nr:hypothetical protein [Pyrinomonadaceae bacterium]